MEKLRTKEHRFPLTKSDDTNHDFADHSQEDDDCEVTDSLSEEESDAMIWDGMLKAAAERLRDPSPLPQSKYLSYWLYRMTGKDDDFNWFSSQLPTWPFTQEDAEAFLVEYGHLSGPILMKLVELNVLKQGNGGYYWMTTYGRSLRHLWAEGQDIEAAEKDCPRTFQWPWVENFDLDELAVKTEIAASIAADKALDWEIRQNLRERHGVSVRFGSEGMGWHIPKLLEDWCDGEDPSVHVDLLHKVLRRVPGEKLAMLQRFRNGAPLMPELRALNPPKECKARS